MSTSAANNEASASTDCYTPGSWHAYANTVSSGNSKGQDVRSDSDLAGRVCRDASVGDANLIAAAPDLLAAIKKVLTDECSDEKMRDEFGGYVLDNDVREQCEAAIAKAVGV